MRRPVYVLAEHGKKIELAQIFWSNEYPDLAPGFKFERMTGSKRETWIVVKTFEHDDHNRLEALVTLIGLEEVKKLFKIGVNALAHA